MPSLQCLEQRSKRFDAMSIQISRVTDYDRIKRDTSLNKHISETFFIYEEISNDTDMVTYAIPETEENIRRNYPWFFLKNR